MRNGVTMIKFATIGTSAITERFIEAGCRHKEFKLEGVYSRNQEKAAIFGEKYGVKKYYHQLKEIAEDKSIDAVYIASPNSLHFQQADYLMRTGKHILCEKCLASNDREVTALFQTARENEVILLEAMRSIFDPGYESIKENLYKIGQVRKINFNFCQYSSRYNSFKQGNTPNIFNPALSAGALMDIGIYLVQPLIGLFGSPEVINAMSLKLKNGIDGMGSVIAQYEDKLAHLDYSKITSSTLASQIQGENGEMIISEISNPRNVIIKYNNGKKEELEIDPCDNNMYYEVGYFMDMIVGKKSPKIYNNISKLSIKLMDQVRKQTGICFEADEIV